MLENLSLGTNGGHITSAQPRHRDSTSVSSHGFRSKVERLLTLSTSAVAVCCAIS